tara:strand:- start:14 stop:517 length:504 start_codon:yes stop_codon:yes gene_type:complete
MISKILHNYLNDKSRFETVFAHCDIPCKIYDPIFSQISVLTMIRLVDLIDELDISNSSSINDKAQFNRLVSQKEEHGIKVKDEISIIWGDYFKKPQFDEFPEIHELTHLIMLQCSKSKQNLDRSCVIELLVSVNRFAEIFWYTKNIKTFKAKCPYPPELALVYPDLR